MSTWEERMAERAAERRDRAEADGQWASEFGAAIGLAPDFPVTTRTSYAIQLAEPPVGLCNACGLPLAEGAATMIGFGPGAYHLRCWPGMAFPVPDEIRQR